MPNRAARYILELGAGQAARHGLSPGGRLSFDLDSGAEKRGP
jgi:uncharacterized membrane protein (UPF0127 family)